MTNRLIRLSPNLLTNSPSSQTSLTSQSTKSCQPRLNSSFTSTKPKARISIAKTVSKAMSGNREAPRPGSGLVASQFSPRAVNSKAQLSKSPTDMPTCAGDQATSSTNGVSQRVSIAHSLPTKTCIKQLEKEGSTLQYPVLGVKSNETVPLKSLATSAQSTSHGPSPAGSEAKPCTKVILKQPPAAQITGSPIPSSTLKRTATVAALSSATSPPKKIAAVVENKGKRNGSKVVNSKPSSQATKGASVITPERNRQKGSPTKKKEGFWKYMPGTRCSPKCYKSCLTRAKRKAALQGRDPPVLKNGDAENKTIARPNPSSATAKKPCVPNSATTNAISNVAKSAPVSETKAPNPTTTKRSISSAGPEDQTASMTTPLKPKCAASGLFSNKLTQPPSGKASSNGPKTGVVSLPLCPLTPVKRPPCSVPTSQGISESPDKLSDQETPLPTSATSSTINQVVDRPVQTDQQKRTGETTLPNTPEIKIEISEKAATEPSSTNSGNYGLILATEKSPKRPMTVKEEKNDGSCIFDGDTASPSQAETEAAKEEPVIMKMEEDTLDLAIPDRLEDVTDGSRTTTREGLTTDQSLLKEDPLCETPVKKTGSKCFSIGPNGLPKYKATPTTVRKKMTQEERIQAESHAQARIPADLPHQPGDHVTIWNRTEQRKIAGNAAPLRRNLERYFMNHPDCEVFTNQTPQSPELEEGDVSASLVRHVAVWHKFERRKVSGNAAPLTKNLKNYLAAHPEFEIYDGQDYDDRIEYENHRERKRKSSSARKRKRTPVRASKNEDILQTCENDNTEKESSDNDQKEESEQGVGEPNYGFDYDIPFSLELEWGDDLPIAPVDDIVGTSDLPDLSLALDCNGEDTPEDCVDEEEEAVEEDNADDDYNGNVTLITRPVLSGADNDGDDDAVEAIHDFLTNVNEDMQLQPIENFLRDETAACISVVEIHEVEGINVT